MRLMTRRLVSFLSFALLVVALVVIWPTQLGGRFTLVIVAGDSMEPTLSVGDMVFAWQSEPEVGDILIYRVPEGQVGEGIHIIHRVTEIRESPEGPVFITQGDNRRNEDHWRPTTEDIVGVGGRIVPGIGTYIAGVPFQLFIAVIVGLIICLWVWPAAPCEEETGEGGDGENREEGGGAGSDGDEENGDEKNGGEATQGGGRRGWRPWGQRGGEQVRDRVGDGLVGSGL